MSEPGFGSSGLLRVAGLPIRFWLASANVEILDQIRRLEHAEEMRNAEAVQLAERIGLHLVPDPALTRKDRAFLLAIRRKLHRGVSIAEVPLDHLLSIPGSSTHAEALIQALVAMVGRDQELASIATGIDAELGKEQSRLLLLPDQVYDESPLARSFLSSRHAPERQARLKLRQHRFEHDWHRITRAATGTTPRDWLSHVALLPIESSALEPPAVSQQFTAQWTGNVRTRRLELADPPRDWPNAGSRLAMNPLHWDADGRLVAVVVKHDGQTHVSVQHTDVLDAICQELVDGVLTFGELAQALGCATGDETAALRSFVRHLVALGILQTSEPPVGRLERVAVPGPFWTGTSDVEGSRRGWVDVYRYAGSGISRSVASDVQSGAALVLRLLQRMQDDVSAIQGRIAPNSGQSWMFADILRADLDVGEVPTDNGDDAVITQAASSPQPGSQLLAFLRRVGERAASGAEVIIDAQMLDECGTPQADLSWPFDCLVRVPADGSDFRAVLDQLSPPGLLDSRFADTLTEMHGQVPHIEAYRNFLRQLEELTGVLFVELLAPPLSDGAANAVRRPLYTRAWTGDPLNDVYLSGGTSPDRYIPLNAIRIRRIHGQLRADVNGQPIWIVHHATRSFSPPWDRVARVLLATAPRMTARGYPRLRDLLTRNIDQAVVPRISVSGGVVLSPGQWRIPTDHLWTPDTPAASKIRTLIRMRDTYSLPRWVYLVSDGDGPLVPCDLESIYAIRTIERHTRGKARMNAIEMMPSPDQLLVIDEAHSDGDRLASQIHLRFPHDESPGAMAARIAPAVIAAWSAADLPSHATMTPSNCRGPPARGVRFDGDPQVTPEEP